MSLLNADIWQVMQRDGDCW